MKNKLIIPTEKPEKHGVYANNFSLYWYFPKGTPLGLIVSTPRISLNWVKNKYKVLNETNSK